MKSLTYWLLLVFALSLGTADATNFGDIPASTNVNTLWPDVSVVPGTAPSAGQVLVGNAGGTAYAPKTISGSGATISLSSAGLLTISSIPNASLTNSAITIAGTSTSLGGSITLDTISGVSSNGFLKRTGANTWTNDSSTYLTGNQTITLSGDATGSGTTAITVANANLPDGVTQAGALLVTNEAAPSTPASGKTKVYVDSTSKNFASKNDAGTVNHGVQTKASVASNFLTAISDAGAVSAAQPTASDVGLGSVTNDAQTKAAVVPNTAPSSGQILVGNAGGTAYAPQTLSGSGATATLSSSGVLTLSAIPNATLSNSSITIGGASTALGGTVTATTILDSISSTQGVVLYRGASSWLGLGTGTAGSLLRSGGASANPSWTTPTFPNAASTSGKVLVSDGTNFVTSTPTFPNASATSRKIIVSDGTNWTASTETYATPGTSGNLLTSDGTNWTSAAPRSIVHTITANWDGEGVALSTGKASGYFTVPGWATSTITAYSISADTGTCTIQTWKKAAGTAVPTSSDSISTSGVSLSTGTHVRSTTTSDFTTTTVTAGDIIAFNLSTVGSSPTQITFELEVTE